MPYRRPQPKRMLGKEECANLLRECIAHFARPVLTKLSKRLRRRDFGARMLMTFAGKDLSKDVPSPRYQGAFLRDGGAATAM